MKYRKVFLRLFPVILVFLLLLAACAAPVTGPSAAEAPNDSQAASAAPAEAAAAEEPPTHDGIVFDEVMVSGDRNQIVTFVADFPLEEVGKRTDLSVLAENWEMRRYRITDGTPSDALAEKMNEAAKNLGVDVYIEPNKAPNKGGGVFGSRPVFESEFDNQWAWFSHGVNLPLESKATGKGITVAVFDSCPTQQPAWVDALYPITAVQGINNDFMEQSSGVASIIDHMAPEANIELYCVLAPDNSDTLADFIRGLSEFYRNHPTGRGVIHLSFRYTQPSGLLDRLVEKAIAQNFVIIAPAGDDNTSQTVYPIIDQAKYAELMLTVAGSDYDRQRSVFSNAGNVAAPAGQQLDQKPPSEDCASDSNSYMITRAESSPTGYLCSLGTIFAASLVSGEAALVLEQYPELSALEVLSRIRSTAEPTDPSLGAGIVNVTKALE